MEAISGDSSSPISQNEISTIKSHLPISTLNTKVEAQPQASTLSNISQTASRAALTTPDIREDVIKRAKDLIADPSWLSDENISHLSEKLLQVEDFEN